MDILFIDNLDIATNASIFINNSLTNYGIGTIEAFYHANLGLTQQPHPNFSFYDEESPIYTRSRHLPPTKILDCRITESIIAEGCILKECRIDHSVLGLRSRVEAGCVIEDTLLMGSDFYQAFSERSSGLREGEVSLGIGSNIFPIVFK